ncbi:MAG TPA: class I SAM-dependent methyltransferase [Methylomirabilota bacterium]|nr:class I SAM-dependent methyltransferase [Methylomirabilota bacterium]
MAHGHEHGHGHGHGHKFRPERAGRLHSAERDARQHWKPLLDLLDLKKITAVADVGAGTGYFAIPLAQALAGQGEVYALDTSAEMLAILRERVGKIRNLHVIQTGEPKLPLNDASVGAVLLINMLHEFNDLKASLREVRRILRPGGIVVVSDWKKIPTSEGPPLEVRFTEDEARAALESAGFCSVTFHDLYPEHFTFTCLIAAENKSS